MYSVKWIWIDGSEDAFTVETREHAERMQKQLCRNELIVSVEIEYLGYAAYLEEA